MSNSERESAAPPKPRRVQQKQNCGCTVAAIAMIVGKSYDEVATASTRDFDNDGLQIEDWFDYLFEHGFATYRMYRVTHIRGVNREREVWPPIPFAPIHLCSVTVPQGAHAVVMLADGTVLDPNSEIRTKLADYLSVPVVWGLFDLRERGTDASS